MLDPGSAICDFFVFDKTGADSVAGADILTDRSGGQCGGFLTGTLNPMVGTRTSRASALLARLAPYDAAVLDDREAVVGAENARAVDAAGATEPPPAAAAVVERLTQILTAGEQ